MSWSEVERAVRMARALAAEETPWFSPALFAARLVVSERCPSLAAIDQWMRIYFNPKLVTELMHGLDREDAISQLAWVMNHEISHAMRQHADRGRAINARGLKWNLACDCEINDSVEWGDLAVPTRFPPVTPHLFHWPTAKLAEFYLQQINQDREWLTQAMQIYPCLKRYSDEAGSGVDGVECSWELDISDMEAPGISSIEQRAVRGSVAKEISNVKQRGKVPAGWVRWAGHVLHPKVDWRDVLRRRVRGAITQSVGAKLDYRYDRPHRRASVYSPFLRPSLRSEGTPSVACVVDTSGSMSPDELAAALSEVAGVLESIRTPITVIPCDSQAYEAARVLTRNDLIRLATEGAMRGGGGTDMRVGIDAALALQPKPDAVVVLTDGHTPYPAERHRTPILFGIFDTPYGPGPLPGPPWREEDVLKIPAA